MKCPEKPAELLQWRTSLKGVRDFVSLHVPSQITLHSDMVMGPLYPRFTHPSIRSPIHQIIHRVDMYPGPIMCKALYTPLPGHLVEMGNVSGGLGRVRR